MKKLYSDGVIIAYLLVDGLIKSGDYKMMDFILDGIWQFFNIFLLGAIICLIFKMLFRK